MHHALFKGTIARWVLCNLKPICGTKYIRVEKLEKDKKTLWKVNWCSNSNVSAYVSCGWNGSRTRDHHSLERYFFPHSCP
jgi:hypothetical protein